MASEWREVKLGDVAELIRGVSYRPTELLNGGPNAVPLLRATNIGNRTLDFSDVIYVPTTLVNESQLLRRFDVVVAMSSGSRSAVGRLAQLRQDWAGCVGAFCGVIRPDPKRVHPEYLGYAIQSPDFRTRIEAYAEGTAIMNLSRERLLGFSMRLPPLPEQRAIAHILGTLDDKIELNRRMSETLEGMAQALFKAWFVDFEPVRAKAEGRDPGLPQPLADLFPARLVDSELGEIPEGWGVGAFGSFTSQRTECVGSLEVVVLSAVADGKLVRSDDYFTKRVYSKDIHKYLLVEQWDFAYNPSRINIGSIGMLEDDILGGVSPVYVVVRSRPAYVWFLEFSLRRSQTRTWINTLASGSVRQSLSYYDFASIPCVLPPAHIAEEFNRRWSVLRDGIRCLKAESRTLAALRDALLPKLIRGEIRVKDAEKFLKEGAA